MKDKPGATPLLVGLEVGAIGLRGNSEFKEAHVLYQELIDEMTKGSSVPPARRAEIMLALAELERSHGVASAARPLVDKAYRLLGGKKAPASHATRKALELLRTFAYEDGELGIFEAATRRIWKIDEELRDRKKGLESKSPTPDPFALRIVLGECTSCDEDLVADARRHLLDVLAVARNNELMRRGFAHIPKPVAWAILSSKNDVDSELREAAGMYVETLISNEVTGQWNNNRTSLEAAGLTRANRGKVRLAYLFTSVFSEAGDRNYLMPLYAKVLLGGTRDDKIAALTNLLDKKKNESFDYYETRDVSALIASLADGVRFGDALDDPVVSSFFLTETLNAIKDHTTNEKNRQELEVELSRFILPALARLALADLKDGRRDQARKHLDRAQRIINVRLAREWRVA